MRLQYVVMMSTRLVGGMTFSMISRTWRGESCKKSIKLNGQPGEKSFLRNRPKNSIFNFLLPLSVTSFYDIRVRLHSWLEKIETKRAHLKDVFNEHDFFTTRIKVPILLSEKETSNQIDDHHDDEDLFGNNSKVCGFKTFGKNGRLQIRSF